MHCKCKWYEEWKFPCYCAWGLIIKEDLNPMDKGWFDERCHASSMMEACSYEPPIMALHNGLKAEMLVPPEHRNLPGRPKKRRESTKAREDMARIPVCQACGKERHYQTSCKKPDTKYRMDKFGKKAWDWAMSQCNINVQDHDNFIDKQSARRPLIRLVPPNIIPNT